MGPALSPRMAPGNPFPGLRFFTAAETHLYFGRDGQSDELVRKLEKSRFVAVTGSSGSGKSSLVRAGLLPSLCAGYLVDAGPHWASAILRPRNTPIANLSAALMGAGLSGLDPDSLTMDPKSIATAAYRDLQGKNLLILVDQFEEIFRFTARHDSDMADRDEKDCFVHLLLEAARQREVPIYVVITLRSDFLGDCSRFCSLPEAINESQYLVPRLSREQRRQAIEGPIRVYGASIAPRLVQRLLNVAGDDSDQLPALQHALMRTWSHWLARGVPDEPIDFEDYEAIGMLESALSQHADESLEEACKLIGGDAGLRIVKRMFQRLSDRDQHGRETRRPTSVKELLDVCETSLENLSIAVDCFRTEGRSFLTPFRARLSPELEIDVTHECLLRKWKILRDDWNKEEAESRRVYVRLATRAEDAFNAPGEKTFFEFLTGPILDRTIEWWYERAPNAAWANRYHPAFQLAEQYLWASRSDRDDQLMKVEVQRQQEEQRRIEEVKRSEEAKIREARLQAEAVVQSQRAKAYTFLAFLVVIALAVCLGFLYTIWKQERRATVNMMAGRAAIAATESDKSLAASALLAAESLRREQTIEAQDVLTRALSLLAKPLPPLPVKSATDAEFSPDGTLLGVARLNFVDLYAVKSGELRVMLPHPGPVTQLEFGEGYLATASGKEARIWDFHNGKLAATLQCGDDIDNIAMGPDGLTVVVACGQVHLWSSAEGWAAPKKRTLGQTGPDDRVASVAISRDETRVAWQVNSSPEPQITLVDLRTNHRYRLSLSTTSNQIAFDPLNPEALITADADGTLRSWNYTRLKPAANSILKLSSSITEFSFADSGKRVAVCGKDGAGKVWDTSQSVEIARFLFDGTMNGVALSPAGDQIVAVGQDGLVHRWSVEPYSKGLDLVTPIVDAQVSGGATLVLAFQPPLRSLVNTANWKRSVFEPGDAPYPAAMSADGKAVAYVEHREGSTGSLSLWDFKNGTPGNIRWNVPSVGVPTDLVFSMDNRYLAGWTDHRKRRISVWDATDGKLMLAWDLHGALLSNFVFDPDCKSIFLPGRNGLKRHDLASGNDLDVPWAAQQTVSSLDFSPDGRLAALVEPVRAQKSGDSESGSNPGSVHLLSYPAGVETGRLEHPDRVTHLAFSADSSHLATSTEKMVRLWDLRTMREVARVPVSSQVTGIGLTPDLQIAITDQRRVSLNDWRPDDLIRDLCHQVSRNLTKREWNRYLPGEEYHKVCPDLPSSMP